MTIMENEFFTITEQDEKLYITVLTEGCDILSSFDMIQTNPRISITSLMNFKNALAQPSQNAVEFGRLKPKIELSLSPDSMEATLVLNITDIELESHRKEITDEVLTILALNHIEYGILFDTLNHGLIPRKAITIAKGVLPSPGTDAQVRYLEVPIPKPTITHEGKADYYNLNLFHYVHKDAWLGEKILGTPGIPGKNIKGEILNPKEGKDKPLLYDENSVEAIPFDDKIVLQAKMDGAVHLFNQGRIGVVNHLILHGDVGYETGNVYFDGYVTVNGTVQDGFSIVAEKDISIQGEMGIGAVAKIISNTGSIYIKGGVSGKGKTIIEADKSIFIKYANACTIRARDCINIGFYALDSNITAKNIIVESKKGRTIGGTIEAKNNVVLRTVGNIYEKRTFINVEGFDRKELKQELDELLCQYKKLLIEIEKNSREIKIYENMLIDIKQLELSGEHDFYKKMNEQLMDQLYRLEERRNQITETLTSRGEGAVSILDKAYPQTMLEIKRIFKRIQEVSSGTFYVVENQLLCD